MPLPHLSRRRFLAGAAATASLPLFSRTALPTNPRVVVVGAGAAGLAATRRLLDAGLEVILIEARQRIGGRAHTETTTFGVPYDRGCHWLHVARLNPWVEYGLNNGFTLYPASEDYSLRIGAQAATPADIGDFEETYEAIYHDIGSMGSRGADVSAASVANQKGPWAPLVAAMIGPWSMGKDLEDFSCLDWWSGEDGADYYCREGFGTMVTHYGRDLPVRLGTPATRIRWGGKGVTIETPDGTLDADAAIITVSTGVLAAERIAFDPPLPLWKQEAFQRISMGHYNNVALQFSEDVFGIEEDTYLFYRTDSQRALGVLAKIAGTNLNFGFVGGSFARELEREGEAAGIAFALEELRKLIGNRIDRAFVKGAMTRWGEDPWTLGAYASAEPGQAHRREDLRAPLGDRLFFAGEAYHESLWATCGGAYLSGQDTADQLYRTLQGRAG